MAVEGGGGGGWAAVKELLQLANFTLGPDATLNHNKLNRKQNGQLLKVTKMLASQHN